MVQASVAQSVQSSGYGLDDRGSVPGRGNERIFCGCLDLMMCGDCRVLCLWKDGWEVVVAYFNVLSWH